MAIIIENGRGEQQISWEGRVLQTYEVNRYDDSDFYAIVWDGEMLRHVEFATTRYWTYNNVAKVDATPEVLAEARRYLIEIKVKAARAAAEARAREIRAGREVRVVKGRKLPIGTTGRCIAVKDGTYGKYAVVLLPEERRTVNISIGNLEVANPEVEFDEEFVRSRIEIEEGERPNFRLY